MQEFESSDLKAYPSCKICDRGTLIPRKIHRLSGPAVAIGYILLVPSILGMVGCAILFIVAILAGFAGAAHKSAFVTAFAGIGSLAIIYVAVVCFVGGLLGWLLVMRKHVLQCGYCGAIINAYAITNAAEHAMKSARRAERWRKAGISFLLIAVAALILFFISDYDAGEQVEVTLPVTVVPTTFGLPGEETPTYPASFSVEVPESVHVAAYGGAGQVWLAPRSWTGKAAEGADGSGQVKLYPSNEHGAFGPQITYTVIPACLGCMLSEAAPYFPKALAQWNEDYNQNGQNPILIPHKLKITHISPRVVIYSLPSEHGFLVRGAAFYDPNGDSGYEEVKLVLPSSDERLAKFLLKYFTDHAGQ